MSVIVTVYKIGVPSGFFCFRKLVENDLTQDLDYLTQNVAEQHFSFFGGLKEELG